jgi:pimeloyl-ACP methyl ester carboxylesterase
VSVPGRGEIFLRQSDGPPGAPTIVLLHGWAFSADVNWFSGLYETAASHGPVLAPDLRGHGRGLVLISTALRWRTSLRERVVWNSMAAVEYVLRLGAPEGGMADRYLRMAVEQSPDLERYKSWVKAEMRRGDPSDIAAAGRGLSAFDAREFAPHVDVPTSVVVTAHDRLIRPVRQRELGKRFPAPRWSRWTVPTTRGWSAPKEFNDAVGDALSSVARSSRQPHGHHVDAR